MLKLLRFLGSRRWKNSFLVHFHGHLLMEKESVMQSILSTYPCAFYSLVWWLISELFHAHHTDYLLLVKTCVSICLTFHLSFHAMAVQLSLTLIFATLLQFNFLSTTLRHHCSIWSNSPTQYVVLAVKLSNSKGGKLSTYS